MNAAIDTLHPSLPANGFLSSPDSSTQFFPASRELWQSASVRLPAAACATSRTSDTDATNSFLWSAKRTVGLRCFDSNRDRISSRPSSIGCRQSAGMRIRSMARAGHMMTGWLPRRSKSRHSLSIGEWKPPITVTPASRMALMTLKARSTASPGHCLEQKRPTSWPSKIALLPIIWTSAQPAARSRNRDVRPSFLLRAEIVSVSIIRCVPRMFPDRNPDRFSRHIPLQFRQLRLYPEFTQNVSG